MVSLRLFLVVLSTLVCREYAGDETSRNLLESLVSIGGVTLGFGLLCKFSALSALRRRGDSPLVSGFSLRSSDEPSTQRFRVSRLQIEWLWTGLLPFILLLTGWVQWSNRLSQYGVPDSLSLLALFVPSLMVILLLELTAAQFDDLLMSDLLRNDLQGSVHGTEQGSSTAEVVGSHWSEIWWLRVRLGDCASLSMCLAPVFLIALCNDLIPPLQFFADETSNGYLAFGAAVMLIVLGYPLAIGVWTGVEHCRDEKLNQAVNAMCKASNVQVLRTVIVPSGGRWQGAAIVGWLPMFRRLWLGDGLLARLSPRQLEMVIWHEIAHVRRLHFVWRLFPILTAAGVGMAFTWIVQSASGGVGMDTAPTAWFVPGLAAALSLAVLVLGLGQTSRSCELDADREACRLAETHSDWARAPGTAAAEMAGALSTLLAGSHETSKQTWMHPSLHQRLSALAAQLANRRAALSRASVIENAAIRKVAIEDAESV